MPLSTPRRRPTARLRRFILTLVLLVLLLPSAPALRAVTPAPPSLNHTPLVVYAAAEDGYRELADEIAAGESAPRISDLAELARRLPDTVIWVAAPETLDDGDLMAMAQLWQRTGHYPATGLITGSSEDLAQALWQRGRGLDAAPDAGTTVIAASATDHNGGLDRPLVLTLGPVPAVEPLTKPTLTDALARADYLFWSRHVSSRYWFWYEGETPEDDGRLGAADLPALGPAIVHTPSCASFLPWSDASIALAFVDRGAVAYIADRYPPLNSGFDLGTLLTPPAEFSWPGVPAGLIAQAHNRAVLRGGMRVPNLFVLGDPRVALQAETPYTLTSDETIGGRRLLSGTWPGRRTPLPEVAGLRAPATALAVLPLRIPAAAGAGFIRVTGSDGRTLTFSESDAFANGRLHAIDAGEDKAILAALPGGAFEIEIRDRAPLMRRLLLPLRSAVDLVWVWLVPLAPSATTAAAARLPLTALPVILVGLGLAVTLLRRRRLVGGRRALIVAATIAALQSLLIPLRADHVTVTSYPVLIGPVEILGAAVGVIALTAGGLIWRWNARRRFGRIAGAAVALSPELLLPLFFAAIVTVINIFQAQRSGLDLWPLGYGYVRLSAIAVVLKALVLDVGCWAVGRLEGVEPTHPAKRQAWDRRAMRTIA